MEVIIKREMAARLERIEAAFTDLPLKLHAVRMRYNIAADSFRLLQAMIAIMPESPARYRLLMAAEICIGNLYELANVISTFVQLELAASDYRVLVGLMIDDLDEGDNAKTHVLVFDIPQVEGRAS